MDLRVARVRAPAATAVEAERRRHPVAVKQVSADVGEAVLEMAQTGVLRPQAA